MYYNKQGKQITMEEWIIEDKNRIVKQTELEDKTYISTVYLGLDHNFGRGKPLIFETMVFMDKDGGDHYMERYSTLEEAQEGHERIVERYNLSIIQILLLPFKQLFHFIFSSN